MYKKNVCCKKTAPPPMLRACKPVVSGNSCYMSIAFHNVDPSKLIKVHFLFQIQNTNLTYLCLHVHPLSTTPSNSYGNWL